MKVFLPSSMFATLAERQSRTFIMQNGDAACTAYGLLIETGLDLVRQNGKWKVVHLAVLRHKVPLFLRFYTSVSEAMDGVRNDVEAGKFFDSSSAAKDLDNRANAAVREMFSASVIPMSAPPGSPVMAATKLTSDATQIVGLLGKSIASPDIKALIASLPNTLRISVGKTDVYVRSDEAGIGLNFHFPGGGLSWVSFNGMGYDGFNAFSGPLPSGLLPGQSRREVESQLGRPTRISNAMRVSAAYPRLGIDIEYQSDAPRDPLNPVVSVTFLAPRPDAGAPSTGPSAQMPRLTFRFEVQPGAPDAVGAETLSDTSAPGRPPLLVSQNILFDETAIDKVIPTSGPDVAASLTMTPEGARRMEQISAANIGRRLAILWDGQILMAPVIRSKISGSVLINFASSGGEAECRRFCDKLTEVICTLPTPATQP
jgi:hypothetical protein